MRMDPYMYLPRQLGKRVSIDRLREVYLTNYLRHLRVSTRVNNDDIRAGIDLPLNEVLIHIKSLRKVPSIMRPCGSYVKPKPVPYGIYHFLSDVPDGLATLPFKSAVDSYHSTLTNVCKTKHFYG